MGISIGIACFVAGCAGFLPVPLTSPSIDYTLHVENGTTLALSIIVNGEAVGVTAARDGSDIPVGALPPLPWNVEARSVSGRVVLTLVVASGSIVDIRNADGSGSHSAPGARADLSCGRLDMFPGSAPMMGPAPGPGVPGDCNP
jgi:hypothetical protein